MKKIRGIWNRIIFWTTRHKLGECGNATLFESSFEIQGEKYIFVGSNVRTKSGLHLAAIDSHNGLAFSPKVIIGNNVSINYNVHIACINEVSIGDGSLLASKVFITDHFHGDTSKNSMSIPPSERLLTTKGPVIIGKNVWIGEGAVILPGVTIGDNSIIGANSVVSKNIPAYSVVAGVPAKVIKSYS